MNLGENIRDLRKSKNITQEQLAKRIGVKRSVISKYENNTVNINISTLDEIANALDVTTIQLMYGEEISQAIETTMKLDEDTRSGKITWKESTQEDIQQLTENPKKKSECSNVHDEDTKNTAAAYRIYIEKLNNLGREKANEYIADLLKIEKYTKPDNED